LFGSRKEAHMEEYIVAVREEEGSEVESFVFTNKANVEQFVKEMREEGLEVIIGQEIDNG
jgi:diacylglycerol kinase family enzyme